MKNGPGGKTCEIQGGSQEMAMMVVYGKHFNDNSYEFVLKLHITSPELSLLIKAFDIELSSQLFLGH